MQSTPRWYTPFRSYLFKVIEYLSEFVNEWLSSPLGFFSALLITLAWAVAVVVNLDPHGFLYLYIATAISLVTQFNLAMIGVRTSRSQAASVEMMLMILRNQLDNDKMAILLGQTTTAKLDVLEALIRSYFAEGLQINRQEGLEGLSSGYNQPDGSD